MEPETSSQEKVLHTYDRNAIPDNLLPTNSTLIVGIGGHEAPPNSRLFSYVVPAIELASRHGSDQPQLILSTSLLEKRRQEPQKEEIVDVHTLSKLLLIQSFIREFFPRTFASIDTYFGEQFPQISREAWSNVWNTLTRNDPTLQAEVTQKQDAWHIEESQLLPYALQHAIWFRDIYHTEDHEVPYNQNRVHVSIGGHQEIFFNRFREAIAQLSPEELGDGIAPNTYKHEISKRLIFASENPVPYGQATRGKKNNRSSAEAEISTSTDPFATTEKLAKDVAYTTDALTRLSGGTKHDFVKFWEAQCSLFPKLSAQIKKELEVSNGKFKTIFSILSSQ